MTLLYSLLVPQSLKYSTYYIAFYTMFTCLPYFNRVEVFENKDFSVLQHLADCLELQRK